MDDLLKESQENLTRLIKVVEARRANFVMMGKLDDAAKMDARLTRLNEELAASIFHSMEPETDG